MTTPVSRNPKRQRKKEGHQARRAAELEALRRHRRNRMIVRFALVAGLILAIAVVLSVVGGDDDEDADVASDDTTESTTTTSTTAAIPAENLTCTAPATPQTDLASKPTITPPAEMATDLTCFDHVVGDGEEVPPGATIRAHYVGVLRKDGTQFDASWDRGEPSEFSLDMVIPGWTRGIPGMKVGGRRELVIPAVMAYGAEGRPPSIGPDEDLVFIVDVVGIVE